MKKKTKAKNEFRYNNQTSHPNYVFEESGNKYRAVGITHREKTFGRANMSLDKNPDPKDTEKAYVRNGIISDKKSNFSSKPIKRFAFQPDDFAKVKSKVRNYKKKRKKKPKANAR